MSSSALFDFLRERRLEEVGPAATLKNTVRNWKCFVSLRHLVYIPGAFFLLRLDFRLDEADSGFSEGGMEGPAGDLEYVSS